MSLLNLQIELWLQAWVLTLFHTLWQGSVIALVAMGMLWATRKAGARLRHDLLVASLAVFVMTALLTFTHLLNSLQELAAAAAPRGEDSAFLMQRSSSPLQSLMQDAGLMRFCMWLYSAGVIFMLARSVWGWRLAARYRNREVHLLPRHWQNQVSTWFAQWQVDQAIPVLESARVHAPMVVGVMKQTLLLPVGFVTALPVSYVQAILAHELWRLSYEPGLPEEIFR